MTKKMIRFDRCGACRFIERGATGLFPYCNHPKFPHKTSDFLIRDENKILPDCPLDDAPSDSDLYGKEAEEFVKKMDEREKAGPTEKDLELAKSIEKRSSREGNLEETLNFREKNMPEDLSEEELLESNTPGIWWR